MSYLPSPTALQPAFHPAMKSLLANTWHLLDQTPPPSLREILEAYRAKGDGDRDMLLAMLNAKTAEDQRIASISSLHRTMLDLYHSHQYPASPGPQIHPLQIPDAHHHAHAYAHPHVHSHRSIPSPPSSYQRSPPPHAYPHEPSVSPRARSDSASSSTSFERTALPQPRKRRRTSRSPPPARERRPRREGELPPSPTTSGSSALSGGGSSPRSRESMAIGSLLSDAHAGRRLEGSFRTRTPERTALLVPRER